MAQVTKAPDLRLSVVATLPPEVIVRLLSEIDVISRRMTRQILSGISLPDSRFRTLGYFRTVTAACRDALRTFVRLLRDGRGLRAGDLERLGSMGAQQAELDVPLELVFGAYRLAARVLWDEVIGQPAVLNDVPPSTVIGLTSTVLEYFDEISAAVGGAYLETRERLLRQRDRDRDRILQRLLAGDATAELRRIAASAELTLLPPYTVVACSAPTIEAERQLEETWRAEGAHLIGEEPGLWIALVPEGRDLSEALRRGRPGRLRRRPGRRDAGCDRPVVTARAPGSGGGPDPVSRAHRAYRCGGGRLRRTRRRPRGDAHLRRPRARPARRTHAQPAA